MTKAEMRQLLERSESSLVDWKRDFPKGLHGRKGDLDWDKGRGTLLKDLVAIANGDPPGPGHLVYGVADRGHARSVVGISSSWDDATFQIWAENTFDPVPSFSYSEIALGASTVGVFQIELVPEYPHVVVKDVGGVLCDGQVWFRQGTKNTVAHRSDLERMIKGEEPFKIGSLDDPKVKQIIQHYRNQGREISIQLLSDRDARLADGYELARSPGTRREVWVGYGCGVFWHIALLKPRGK